MKTNYQFHLNSAWTTSCGCARDDIKLSTHAGNFKSREKARRVTDALSSTWITLKFPYLNIKKSLSRFTVIIFSYLLFFSLSLPLHSQEVPEIKLVKAEKETKETKETKEAKETKETKDSKTGKDTKKIKTTETAETVKCGKITYAKSKTSVCFSDLFLSEINSKTSIKTDINFNPVKLDSDEIFDFPFCVISGEDKFTLTEKEKANLKKYLLNGGFILASPGCSNAEWNKSFRQALASIFPDNNLKKIDMAHPIFSVFYKIDKLTLKNGGTTQIEGLEIDGRIALVYSAEGLNDVANAKGCCCCGGNEIKECQQVNINIFLYSMLF